MEKDFEGSIYATLKRVIMYNCGVRISGLKCSFELYSEGTVRRFRDYLVETGPDSLKNNMSGGYCSDFTVSSGDIILDKLKGEEIKKDSYLEFVYVMIPFSDQLLRFNRVVLHGTAFIWNGKAFVFCGPSGVGKSTQFRNWKRLYGDEVHILNGDKPIIEWVSSEKDLSNTMKGNNLKGKMLVHPSPWNGKEGWRGDKSAELAGLIYLEQGKENHLKKCIPSEVELPLLQEIFYSASSTELNRCAADMVRRLLSAVPVWKVVNDGSLASSVMIRDTLKDYFERS